MLRFYFEVARTAFRRQMIYRWANIAGLCTNIFFGAIFSYVIIALYHAHPPVAGYDVRDTLRYTWMAQALVMVVLPFGWTDLMQTIRSGDVVSDLSKPCDFYGYWFSREMGRNAYFLLFRGLPVYLAGLLLFQFGLTTSWQSWLVYGLVLSLGMMQGVAYRFLYNLLAFWMLEARAVVTFALTIALFFAGSYVPIPLFPSWLRSIVDWLPFHGFMDLPVQVFLGKIPGNLLWFELVRQLGWLILLTMFVQLLSFWAKQHVNAQGG